MTGIDRRDLGVDRYRTRSLLRGVTMGRGSRRISALCVASVLAAAGCWGEGYSVVAQVTDAAVAERAVGLEAHLVRACEDLGSTGADPYEPVLSIGFRTDGGSPDLGQVDPGRYGLYVRVRNEGCQVIAAGCLATRLESGGEATLVVEVVPVSGPACDDLGVRCELGLCLPCTPDCEGRECGSDGCEHLCGPGCGEGELCDASGTCVDEEPCTPSCDGRECGSDGCDGSCEPGCGDGQSCDAEGRCFTVGAFVTIPEGTFFMGSPAEEADRDEDETLRQVELTHSFEILSTEVTNGELDSVLTAAGLEEHTSRNDSCPGCPADSVSWDLAARYCNFLSRDEGAQECYSCTSGVACTVSPEVTDIYDCEGYRLPTEAEWELAARAGTLTATFMGDLSGGTCPPELEDIAWYDFESGCQSCGEATCLTQQAGTLEPNPWGLFDVLGNVEEWCHDWLGSYADLPLVDPVARTPGATPRRVVRGGSFDSPASQLRAANRWGYEQARSLETVGFRVARTRP